MSARAATQAASYSKGLILAILLERKELSLRDLVLCFVSCKAFRELVDGRGFCIGTAWLCACLESGRNPTEILSKLRSARCSLADERPLSRVNQVTSFLTRYEDEDHSGDGRWMWAQLLYQEPDGGVLCEGMKKMLWVYKHRLIKQLHKPTGNHPGLCTLKGHSASVNSVAFSPDGKYVASGSGERGKSDDSIRIWDVATGKEAMGPLRGHSESVYSVAWSPCGNFVASGSGDGTVKVWEVQTGSEKYSLKGHSAAVNSVAFSPDGKYVASGSGEWGKSDNSIVIWDFATGKEAMDPLKGHKGSVCSVAWSPCGNFVASGSWDKKTKIWDVVTGSKKCSLKGHPYSVYSVAWSPCGNLVASGSEDSTVQIWDIQTGSEKCETGSEKCSLKGTIVSWQNLDLHTKELAAKVKQGGDSNRTGQYIVTAHGDMVYVYVTNSDGEKQRDGEERDGEERDGEERDGEEPLACFRSPASVNTVSCMGTSVVVGCEDGQVLFLEAPLLSA